MSLRYKAMIGVGGIGSGTFFALTGNETLGREESRGGRLLDRRDYCKLHIIAHYVQRLLGAGFRTIPVGMVGDDEVGRGLIEEMSDTGLDTRYVQAVSGVQTMYSICLLYPDGCGGNLTTEDSAASRLTPAGLEPCRGEFERYRGLGIALAAPEVPLPARVALLRIATEYQFFRAASFTRDEVAAIDEALPFLDLVALNRGEAAAVIGMQETADPPDIALGAISRIVARYPHIRVVVTAGNQGSWSGAADGVCHMPALRVPVVNTAGAGDAFLAGCLVAEALGLPSRRGQTLATQLAAFSVTSPHTIHEDARPETLLAFSRELGWETIDTLADLPSVRYCERKSK